MRSVRRAGSALGATALFVMFVIFATPTVARADGEYLKVTPSTIQAGFQVEIEGFCGDNVNPAFVKSDAFGVVTITPTQDSRAGRFIHRGTATVPRDKMPRAYPVSMTCPSQVSATTTLHVVNNTVPPKGPMTGGGALATKSMAANAFTFAGVGAIVLGSLVLLVRRRRKS